MSKKKRKPGPTLVTDDSKNPHTPPEFNSGIIGAYIAGVLAATETMQLAGTRHSQVLFGLGDKDEVARSIRMFGVVSGFEILQVLFATLHAMRAEPGSEGYSEASGFEKSILEDAEKLTFEEMQRRLQALGQRIEALRRASERPQAPQAAPPSPAKVGTPSIQS